jgi:hypothetical protein
MAKPKSDDSKSKIATVETKPESKLQTSRTGIATIPGVRTRTLTTLLIGTAPLIVHKFSQKLIGDILAKHKGEASAGREAKDPEANFQNARYRLTDGSDGVPAGGVKAAFISGFVKGSGVTLKSARGIRVLADDPATNLVRIYSTPDQPRMREDVVRNASGVVDIRHRPEFWPWAMLPVVEYIPSQASDRQILQAIAMAGFIEGFCEWRPNSKESKSGTYGTWRLATAAEVEAFEKGKLFELLAAQSEQEPQREAAE